MALKPIKVLYQAKNNTTGLTDVKAQVYVNSVAKAVGVSAIVLVELDATNSAGEYTLSISGATLAGYGAVAGDDIEIKIDSVSKSAPSGIRFTATAFSTDDLDAHLVTQDTNIAAIKLDTAAIKTDLESGASSLATILSAVQAIQNNAGFSMPVPATLIKPSSGSNTYRLPISIYNEKNMLLDPDSNTITVTLVNQAGADRSVYLVGVSGTSAPAVRDSLGQYRIDLAIPSTASQEELIFSFAYTIGGTLTARKAVSEIISDVQADGFALQTTLLSVQTTVNDADAILNNATYGLSAANTLQGLIKTQTDKLGDATIGLSAIKAQTVATQAEIVNNVEGAGFATATDSLHAISAYISANVFSGGRAI